MTVCKKCGHELEETIIGWLHTANTESYHKEYLHICGKECIDVKENLCCEPESLTKLSLSSDQIRINDICKPKIIKAYKYIHKLGIIEQLKRKLESSILYMSRNMKL